MTPITRLRHWLAGKAAKAAGLTFLPSWFRHSFMQPAFWNLIKYGYKENATVFACVSILARTFPEPELWPWLTKNGQDQKPDNHPMRRLLKKPNADMGEAELFAFTVIYCAIGGNAYLWKQRDNGGRTIALWPFHDGYMQPIPGRNSEEGLVAYYVLDIGDGQSHNIYDIARFDGLPGVAIPKSEIIHWKWMIDPEQPWRGIGALTASFGDLNVANEVRDYIFSLLKNDAKPPIVVNLAEGDEFDEDRVERLGSQWAQKYGGSNRGRPAFLEYGMQVKELGFNLQQLEIDSLRDGPDAAICMGFGIHPAVVGAMVGLKNSTYSNYEEASRALTLQTLVPLWRAFASEVQQSMSNEPGYKETSIRFDLSMVRALVENEDKLREFALGAFNAGGITRSEFRQLTGQPVRAGDDVYKIGISVVFEPAGAAQVSKALLPASTARKSEVKAHEDSAMVAFFLSAANAQRLVAAGSYPPGSEVTAVSDMHLTLTFLGDTADIDKDSLHAAIAQFAERYRPVAGKINGYGRFTNIHRPGFDAIYATFDAQLLPGFRQALIDALAYAGIESPSEHGFVPHITLAYVPAGEPLTTLDVPPLEMTFDAVTVAYGGDRAAYRLSGDKDRGSGGNGRLNGQNNGQPPKAVRAKPWGDGLYIGDKFFPASQEGSDIILNIEYGFSQTTPERTVVYKRNGRLNGQNGDIAVDFTATKFPTGDGGASDQRAPADQVNRQRASINALRKLRTNYEAPMTADLEKYFTDWAQQVEKRLSTVKTRVPAGIKRDLSDLTDEELDALLALVFQQEDEKGLTEILDRYTIDLTEASWPIVNEQLGLTIAFDETDPAVVAALADAGGRIKNIMDTTRAEVVDILQLGGELGWSIEDIARGRDDIPGIADVVKETYKNRAETIARTELGTAQATATAARYDAAGFDKVIVFDNGFDNSHPVCVGLDGTVQSVEWYKKNKLQHPNCVRAVGPYFED